MNSTTFTISGQFFTACQEGAQSYSYFKRNITLNLYLELYSIVYVASSNIIVPNIAFLILMLAGGNLFWQDTQCSSSDEELVDSRHPLHQFVASCWLRNLFVLKMFQYSSVHYLTLVTIGSVTWSIITTILLAKNASICAYGCFS